MKFPNKIIGCILSFSMLTLSQNQTIVFKTCNSLYKIYPTKQSQDALEIGIAKGKYCYAFFNRPINSEFANELKSAGIIIVGSTGRYSGSYAYKINLNGKNRLALQILEKSPSFLSLIPISSSDKVESAIFNGEQKCLYNKEKRTVKAVVYLEDPLDFSKAENAFGNLVDSIVFQAGINEKYIVFGNPEKLRILATNDLISNINLWHEDKISNDYARKILKVDSLQKSIFIKTAVPSVNWLKDVPFTGDSIWVWNTEDSIGKHIDFCEIDGNDTVVRYADTIRVLYKDYNWGFTFHGLATMGVLCGNGWGSLASKKFPGSDTMQWRGIAPKCLIRFSDDADIINKSFAEESGFYTYTALKYDEKISNHDTLDKTCNNIWTLASGNDGDAWGYYSLRQTSKNGIVVGAVEKGRPVVWNQSSMGPTRDGRIKPDVMAPGEGMVDVGYEIELDSVAIVNSGLRAGWSFSDSNNYWDYRDFRVYDSITQNSVFKFKAYGASYINTDPSNRLFPKDTIVSSINDTLIIRWRIKKTHPLSPDIMNCALLWSRPQDAGTIKGETHSQISRVFIDENADTLWHLRKIALGDTATHSQNGGWVDGDTLSMLRLDFGLNPHINGIISQRLNNDYESDHGTSEAAPFAAGVAALILQKYRDMILRPWNQRTGQNLNVHDNPLWSSTVRGILIHTAEDIIDTLGNIAGYANADFSGAGFQNKTICTPGPDWASGWGLINAVKALAYVDTLHYLESVIDQDSIKRFPFRVLPGTDSLRVTLCWDDPPSYDLGTDYYHSKLINDLDLYIVNVSSGDTVRPWVLDHDLMHDDTLPGDDIDRKITPALIMLHRAHHGIDSLNNVEVVDVVAPDTGMWQIVVDGRKILMDQRPGRDQSGLPGINQDFSLVFDIAPQKAKVIPAFKGIQRKCGGTFEALLEYVNQNGYIVTIPRGPDNHFHYHGSDVLDMGQPAIFRPGYGPDSFSVNFDGSALSWELDGSSLRIDTGLSVQPVLEEVYYRCADSQYVAIFGYQNNNRFKVIISDSCINGFAYNGQSNRKMGQPTVFDTGYNTHVFKIAFNGSSLTWSLNGKSVAAGSSGVQRECIRPFVDEVVDNCDGTHTAFFGYESPHDTVYSDTTSGYGYIPNNYFNGTLRDIYSQSNTTKHVSAFEPGMHHYVFSRIYLGDSLSWILEGYSALALSSSAQNQCPGYKLYKAFAFGADTFTRKSPNDTTVSYIKISRNGPVFLFDSTRGFGYTDTNGIDSARNRGIFDGADEIYDQSIGVRKGVVGNITFRVNCPPGTYRFVAAGGDPLFSGHYNSISIRGGYSYNPWQLMDDSFPANSFYRVGFEGKFPPASDGSGQQPVFDTTIISPTIKTFYYPIFINQSADYNDTTKAGGDLCLLELWRQPGYNIVSNDLTVQPGDTIHLSGAFEFDGYHHIIAMDSTAAIVIDSGAIPAAGQYAAVILRPNGSIRAVFGNIQEAIDSLRSNELMRVLTSSQFPFDATGKRIKWTSALSDTIMGTTFPALSRDGHTLYFGTKRGVLCAVNTATGAMKWKKKLSGEVWGAPVVHNDTVFIATKTGSPPTDTINGAIWAVTDDRDSCRALWYRNHRGDFIGSVAIDTTNNLVFAGSNNDTAYAFTFQGNQIWKYGTLRICSSDTNYGCTDGINSSPTIFGNSVVVATSAGMLYFLDKLKGINLIKPKDFGMGGGGSRRVSPVASGQRLYIGDMLDGKLRCYQAGGFSFDSVAIPGCLFSRDPGPAISNGQVYTQITISGHDDTVAAMDFNNHGSRQYSYTEPGLSLYSSVTLGNGASAPKLYVPTMNNMLLVLDQANPSANISLALPGRSTSCLIAPDSTLYLLCGGNAFTGRSYLLAIKTDSRGMPHSWPCARGDAQNTGYSPDDAHPDIVTQGIGAVSGLSGTWDEDYKQYTLCGASAGIGGSNDNFGFSYTYVAGDFEMKAKVVSLDTTNGWALAGIMARASLDMNSAHGFIYVSATHGGGYKYRLQNGDTTRDISAGAYAPGNVWLKLVRVGAKLSGYISGNGTAYTKVKDTDIGTGNLYVGLAHTSYAANSSGCAQFNEIRLSFLPGNEYGLWGRQQKIFLNTASSGANVSNTVTNFPVLVRLNSGNFTFASAQSDGSDIRFANSKGVHLTYQIERWDPSAGLAEIWVKSDTIFGNDSTQYIMMYWANEYAVNESAPFSVFDTASSFVGVWHMNQNPGATAPQMSDATANAVHGSSRGSMTSANLVDGMVGKAISLDGSNDYINMGRGAKVDITGNVDMTISAWAKLTVRNDWNAIAGKGDHQYHIQFRESPVHDEFCIYDDDNWQPAYDLSKPEITAGTWYYIAGTYNHANQKLILYRNGDSIATASAAYISSSQDDSLCIGVNSEYWSRYFNGIIDEVRLSKSARSASWVKLEYENQKASQTLVKFEAAPPETLSTWPYSANLHLNTTSGGAGVSGNVSRFPVLVRLNPSNFSGFANTHSGGTDIRFGKSDNTALSYQIERWVDGAGNNDTAEIWVKVDTVYGNNSSQYIKMYWGKSGVSSKSDGKVVFDTSNSFVSAWHLGEEASGTGASGIYKDATANANHGTDYIGATDQGGIIGKGHYFDGTDDYIQVPASSSMNMGSKNVTISFWVKSSASYQYERMLFEHDVWANTGTYQLSSFDGGTLRWNFVGAQAALDYTTDFTDGTWHHVVSVFNDASNSQKIYYDGALASSGSNTGSIGSSTAAAYIGCRGGTTMYFPGYIDEMRVSKTNRSADWIKLEYQNQKASQTLVEY